MGYRNIYQGPRSCYALNEGIYVPGKGVNFQTGLSIAYLILRDYHRGWTYDHYCNRIPMDYSLAKQRLVYLIALAKKHYGESEAQKLREVIPEILVTMRFPERLLGYVRIVGLPIVKRRIKAVARVRTRLVR